MTHAAQIKPTHAAIRRYYETLQRLDHQGADHEMAVRGAFQHLLDETARQHEWTLIPELGSRSAGHTIRPDGTIRDANGLPRGWWEAKDPTDCLDTEIARKTAKGYPLANTIFENRRSAVLYQNRQEILSADLGDPGQLAELLNQFYSHVESHFVGWEISRHIVSSHAVLRGP